MTQWHTASLLKESNYGRLMVGTTVEKPKPKKKHSGEFEKGHIPWNKGMTWSQMGISKQKQRKMHNNLKKGRTLNEEARRKAQEANNRRKVPIVAEKDGKALFFDSISEFANRYGISRENVRRACKTGWKAGGWKVTRFDEYEQ